MNAVLRANALPLVKLSEAVQINPKTDKARSGDDLRVSFVPMAAVGAGDGRIDTSEVRPVSAVKKGYTAFQDGDVLFARVTPCMENGKIAVARNLVNGMGFGSTEFHVLRPRDGVDPAFICHFVSAERFRREAARHMTGAVGLRRVPAAFLEDAVLPLPHLTDQKHIVSEIERQFSRLDEAVANLRRVKAKLNHYRASVLAEAFEGRLAKCFGGEDWKWSTVREIATVGTGATPLRSRRHFYEGGTVPWVTSSAVNQPYVDSVDQYVTEKALAETNLTLYPPGTLLVAMYGEGRTRGKCSELRISATTNQALAALQVDPSLKAWVKLFLERNYEETRRIASGGVQPNLNLGLIRSIRLPIPSAVVRDAIIGEVERRFSLVSEVASEVTASLARAQALRSAILDRQFAV